MSDDAKIQIKRNRVSNEQVLAAIMATNASLNALVQVLTNQKKEEAPATPATVSHAVVSNGPRLIKDLPIAETLPEGIDKKWLDQKMVKTARWAKESAPGEEIWIYFVRNSAGKHFPMPARATSKAAYNAVSRYKKVI